MCVLAPACVCSREKERAKNKSIRLPHDTFGFVLFYVSLFFLPSPYPPPFPSLFLFLSSLSLPLFISSDFLMRQYSHTVPCHISPSISIFCCLHFLVLLSAALSEPFFGTLLTHYEYLMLTFTFYFVQVFQLAWPNEDDERKKQQSSAPPSIQPTSTAQIGICKAKNGGRGK